MSNLMIIFFLCYYARQYIIFFEIDDSLHVFYDVLTVLSMNLNNVIIYRRDLY